MRSYAAHALSRRQKVIEVRGGLHSPEERIQFTPAATVALEVHQPRKKQPALVVVEVLFDSALHSNFEGVRSASGQTRQMLFRAGPYLVDLHIEAIPDAPRLAIAAQMLSASDPEQMCRGAQVILSNRRGNSVKLITNDFGEFRGEIENSGDLELALPCYDGKPVIISIQNVLG